MDTSPVPSPMLNYDPLPADSRVRWEARPDGVRIRVLRPDWRAQLRVALILSGFVTGLVLFVGGARVVADLAKGRDVFWTVVAVAVCVAVAIGSGVILLLCGGQWVDCVVDGEGLRCEYGALLAGRHSRRWGRGEVSDVVVVRVVDARAPWRKRPAVQLQVVSGAEAWAIELLMREGDVRWVAGAVKRALAGESVGHALHAQTSR